MEEHPEEIHVFSNTEIAILRNGKAKKNDPPIPADLAPISGNGKRVRREEPQDAEPVFLDPIKFRYSTEAVVEEELPAEEETAEVTEEKAERRSNRRRRKPKAKPDAAPKEAAAEKSAEVSKPKAEKKPAKAKPEAPKEAAKEPAAEGEAKPKPHRRKPNYHRRKPKAKPEGGNA